MSIIVNLAARRLFPVYPQLCFEVDTAQDNAWTSAFEFHSLEFAGGTRFNPIAESHELRFALVAPGPRYTFQIIHGGGRDGAQKTIAGLLGPTLVAIAAGMLLNIGSFPALAEQVSHDPALIFVSGILLFVAGLAIVRVHNRWTKGWPVPVTVLGWPDHWCDHRRSHRAPGARRLSLVQGIST